LHKGDSDLKFKTNCVRAVGNTITHADTSVQMHSWKGSFTAL